MTIEWDKLQDSSRLLMEAELQPIQGERFFPTRFPDLNAATYDLHDGTRMLLVESAQSMANRLEAVCWNEANIDLHSPLVGMPYVKVSLPEERFAISLLESHRLNTPYFVMAKGSDGKFLHEYITEGANYSRGQTLELRKFAQTLLRYDPSSLLHGVFFSNIIDGRLRLPRAVSSFIEAKDIKEADSGFAKFATFDPTGKLEEGWIDSLDNDEIKALGYDDTNRFKNRMKETVSNIIGPRIDYTAGKITAYFNVNLAQIRGYGIGETAEQFLIALSLWKIRRLLDGELNLRALCDLKMVGELDTQPQDFAVPGLAELSDELQGLIQQCAADSLFASPAVTEVTFQRR